MVHLIARADFAAQCFPQPLCTGCRYRNLCEESLRKSPEALAGDFWMVRDGLSAAWFGGMHGECARADWASWTPQDVRRLQRQEVRRLVTLLE